MRPYLQILYLLVEKAPSALLRSTASAELTNQIPFRSSVSHWNLFDWAASRVFQCSAYALTLVLSIMPPVTSSAQDEIEATPNRPGVGTPADVTHKGVLELEYGWERAFRSHEFKTSTDFAGLVKFGLAQDIELRFNMDNYISQHLIDREGRRSGVGDIAPGFKYRFLSQDAIRPSLAIAYEVKIPTASEKKGLGSGRYDHSLSFLASKDLLGFECNFTYLLGWLGKEKKGFDDLHLLALSGSHPIFGALGISGEVYGAFRLNRETPGFLSTDWALTYAVTPRLVLDGGVDIGLTSAAKDIAYFAGVTIALVDLYRLFGLTW